MLHDVHFAPTPLLLRSSVPSSGTVRWLEEIRESGGLLGVGSAVRMLRPRERPHERGHQLVRRVEGLVRAAIGPSLPCLAGKLGRSCTRSSGSWAESM